MYKYVWFLAAPIGRNVTLPDVTIRQTSSEAPRAGYADLPPGVGFEPKDEPLRRDINLLGRVLGQVLIEQEGRRLFETEEEIRLLCKRLRFDYDPALDERLRALRASQHARPRQTETGHDPGRGTRVLTTLLLTVSGISPGLLNTG